MTQERKRRLAAVWFADIVGYTELSSRDEDGALAVVDELQRIARDEVESRDGRIVTFQGDTVLAVFDSTDAALKAAIAFQNEFAASDIVLQRRCGLKIGVHVGEIVEAEDGDVYGDGVNLASRIEGVAESGQVVVSEAVYQQIRQRENYDTQSLGQVALKGIPQGVAVFLVGASGTLSPPADSSGSQPTRALGIDPLNSALAGRYVIERELGQGGMATVYLADDLKHERKVALKVLKPELAAAVGAERFLAEIKTTANLQHPHVLPLFDSGEAAGFLFYVMPYVRGESLRQRLNREHQLPVDDAVRIASGVAEALDYAHRQGVIHRDIKPGNVLLQDGEPVVADFGIALAVLAGEEERLTESGDR